MSENTFDYIIVGAGSAGCVLAAQLIRRTQARVLLLEAGGDDNNLFIKMPAGVAKIIAKKSWPYETEPEPHANNRRMQIAQGKVLGGSSSVNGMIYLRGQPQDYDDWAERYGCTGWSYREVLPYFKRAEANESLSDDYHGADGLLPVSENRYRHPLSMAFIRAGQELNLPYRNDFNGDSQHGVGFYQTTTHNGERASTARTYLKAVRDERRLVVKLNALAHRLTFEGNVATGVVYSQNDGAEVTARATKEVIVSAGAVGSPKLLMLSGIGPRDHLQQLGIEVRADLPVGKNFHDHLHMSINVSTREPISLFGADRGLQALSHGAQWLAFRSGVLVQRAGRRRLHRQPGRRPAGRADPLPAAAGQLGRRARRAAAEHSRLHAQGRLPAAEGARRSAAAQQQPARSGQAARQLPRPPRRFGRQRARGEVRPGLPANRGAEAADQRSADAAAGVDARRSAAGRVRAQLLQDGVSPGGQLPHGAVAAGRGDRSAAAGTRF